MRTGFLLRSYSKSYGFLIDYGNSKNPEERGKTWIEADYGKPLMEGKKDYRLPGLTKEQMQIELDSGKLPKPAA